MKIVCLLGSPKPKGNTATILDAMERPLRAQGIDVVRYCLGECHINYCLGCKACFNSGLCVQKDDVQPIMQDIAGANVVIVASPSYWGDVTGQLKVFIDRCTPYCNEKHVNVFAGQHIKGVAVAVRAGKNKKENENLVATIEHFLGHLNIPLVSRFTVEGVDTEEDLKNKTEILQMAYDFGASIISLMDNGGKLT